MTETFRLPREIVPRRYDLEITPDLDASTFTGRVAIVVDVNKTTSTITVNAKELRVVVDDVTQNGTAISATVTTQPDLERVVLALDQPLVAGQAVIHLSFDGVISAGLLGFYRSTYVDANGNEQVLAATQFEAPHARAAFPCFDEPDFKAIFGITLIVRDHFLVLSNGPEIEREVRDGWARVTFAETIPMSTYLVAWVVGPLDVTAPIDAGGIALRVAHAPGKGHLTRFALDVGAHALRFFADYYGIPYPGAKCDLVALPDFSFGAMENLGCVTFRETRLLVDPEAVTLDEMSAAALTIVHEIAHMWFGDLVTMKWWNGIWLNEAFATFMEHLGVDSYRPEWRTWDDFAVGRAAALDVDALSTTRTVEYEVVTPEDADGMFDTLTYQKGGSVLRMLERWLGPDAFRTGVRHYLNRYQLSNTETTDLWDALEDATGKPVRKIMDSWIFQPGFPLLSVDGGRVVQRRFGYQSADGERYAVPVLVRTHHGDRVDTRPVLLGSDAATLDAPADALVVLNAGGEGFYRVAYPTKHREQLLEAGVLQPLERFALVDDLWAAALANEATAIDFLETARRLRNENELVVWRILTTHLRALGRVISDDAAAAYRADVAKIVTPTMQRLGWNAREGDDARTRQLRGLMIVMLGAFVGDDDPVARAREVVAAPAGVDADVVAACITVVASAGTAADFDEFARRADNPGASPQEQLRYLYALGDFPDESLVLRASALALSDDVRTQNAPFLLQRSLRNMEHGPRTWQFIRENWEEVRRRFRGALASRMLEGGSWIVDDETVHDMQTFLTEHPVTEAVRLVAQTLERQRVNQEFVKRERSRFSKALQSS
jgi:puromycin-sensitive aminopeptidase